MIKVKLTNKHIKNYKQNKIFCPLESAIIEKTHKKVLVERDEILINDKQYKVVTNGPKFKEILDSVYNSKDNKLKPFKFELERISN